MIKITEKEKCCGCTACYCICSKQCISMKADEEGFLYPFVDEKFCIDCGQCNKVCPELNGFYKNHIIETYAVRNTNSEILDNSTSGGAFSALARDVLNAGGVVYGAAYDSAFKIIHTKADINNPNISIFCGSKYVQSYMGDIFKEVKELLKKGKTVLFSGTSCQIAGLSNYLDKNKNNLISVEVICHGTPSPLLWSRYLSYQKNMYKSNPSKINFRKKTYGYHSGTMEIIFENGKKYTGSARVDYMLKSFFSEISSRPSCYSCMCKGIERPADLSIFDCWHAEKLIDDLVDDDRGYTNVLVNSEKGAYLMKRISGDIQSYKINTEKAIQMDGIMVLQYPHKNANRDEYYKSLNDVGLEQTIKRYIPITRKDHLIEKSKLLFYKTGVLGILKKMKSE